MQELNGQQQEQETTEGFYLQSDRPKRLYFHIFDNSLCRKSKTAVEGWEGPITTTNPESGEQVTTWIERYDVLVCRIVDVNRWQREFEGGRKANGFEITLLAGGKQAVLSVKWIEPFLKRFLKVARNIDFTKPLRISVFESINRDTGKRGTAVSFKQGDGPNPDDWPKVEEFWGKTRAARSNNPDPNEAAAEVANLLAQGYMPDGIHDEFTDKWDYNAQNSFLGQDFVRAVLPQVKKVAEHYGIAQKAEQQQAQQAPAQQQSAQEARSTMAQARQNYQANQAAQAAPAQPLQPVAPPMPQQGLTQTVMAQPQAQAQAPRPQSLPEFAPPPPPPPVQQQAPPTVHSLDTDYQAQQAKLQQSYMPPPQPQGPPDDDIPF